MHCQDLDLVYMFVADFCYPLKHGSLIIARFSAIGKGVGWYMGRLIREYIWYDKFKTNSVKCFLRRFETPSLGSHPVTFSASMDNELPFSFLYSVHSGFVMMLFTAGNGCSACYSSINNVLCNFYRCESIMQTRGCQ